MARTPVLTSPAAVRLVRFASRALPILLAAVPLLYLIWFARTFYVDVPFWDQWELVPKLDKLAAGTLGVQDLWFQHNEHRPLFPVVLMLVLARLSGWNIAWEIAANVIFGLGIFIVFARALETAPGGSPRWLLPFFAALIFSPAQWENWLWGWQISVLMGVCSALLGLYLTATLARDRWRFVGALGCGVWSTFSFAAGLVYWPVGLSAILAGTRDGRVRRAAAWALVAALTIAAYFHGYVQPAQPSLLSSFSSWDRFRTLLVYTASYLGAPVAAYSEPAAAVVGAAGALAFGLLVAGLWRSKPVPAVLFPMLVALQAVGIASLSALGRAWVGSGQALAPRYMTVTAPFWCALAAMAVLLVRTRPSAVGRRARMAVVTVTLLAVLASSARTEYVGRPYAAARSGYLRIARLGLIIGRSETLLAWLYPDPRIVRQRRAILRMLHLSVFRDSSDSSIRPGVI
ncbi:MAG: hypothetical protein A3H96_23840 [Acidobacteria bacterium RIFCSPLOWO2_02_FULL_67_36]|nr:MAG: hypothetical protein A3H96_23840 [Acidobacteria bacterium RIFCSPLOWO2_02_FULL_67_36]OFW20983.1 MAG: hypothetical protein A3G21_23655 [Acidobacteria bacterium RIFCSPLOWO2_12_FULL_66_21]